MEEKLKGPVNLLRESWDIFTNRLRTLVVIQLVPVITIVPALLLLGAIMFLSTNFNKLNEALLTSLLSFIKIAAPIVGVVMIIFVVLQLWAQVSLLFAIKDNQERIGFREAYKRGWGKLRSYLWATLLGELVILGGFLLFIIPGIIFAVWFNLAGFVVVAEELRGRATLRRSKELIKGRWWGVFGRFLFLGLVALVLLIVLSFAESLWAKAGFSWVGQVVSTVVWFLWTPFAVIYSYLIYHHLKELKNST